MAEKGKDSKLQIDASVKRVSSQEGDRFAADAKKIDENMKKKQAQVKQGLAEEEEKKKQKLAEAARKKAEAEAAAKAQEEAEKKAAEQKAAEEKARNLRRKNGKAGDTDLIGDAMDVLQGKGDVDDMKAIATAALGRAAQTGAGKKKAGFVPGLIVGVAVGLAGGFLLQNILGIGQVAAAVTEQVNAGKQTVDTIVDETFYGYTAADFQNAILGDTTAKQDLEVMDQALVLPTTITKAGLGNLKIFSKVKQCEFAGNGIYTIDMGKMDADHIFYNETTHTVTVAIPHAVLAHVILDEANTSFEDTEKGLLAFGDLALTEEEHNELSATIKEKMTAELEKEDLMQMANDYGQKKVWQILNPLVETVDKNVMLEIVFEDSAEARAAASVASNAAGSAADSAATPAA